MSITQAELKILFNYDESTGIFKWINCKRKGYTGKQAGTLNKKQGYRFIKLGLITYSEHRLAWLYIYGEWPKQQIDHINRIRDDNRIVNLRDATPSENSRNNPLKSKNKTGYKGVFYIKKTNKFLANININNKTIYLGYYDTAEEASSIYTEYAIKHYGEFYPK